MTASPALWGSPGLVGLVAATGRQTGHSAAQPGLSFLPPAPMLSLPILVSLGNTPSLGISFSSLFLPLQDGAGDLAAENA